MAKPRDQHPRCSHDADNSPQEVPRRRKRRKGLFNCRPPARRALARSSDREARRAIRIELRATRCKRSLASNKAFLLVLPRGMNRGRFRRHIQVAAPNRKEATLRKQVSARSSPVTMRVSAGCSEDLIEALPETAVEGQQSSLTYFN